MNWQDIHKSSDGSGKLEAKIREKIVEQKQRTIERLGFMLILNDVWGKMLDKINANLEEHGLDASAIISIMPLITRNGIFSGVLVFYRQPIKLEVVA